MSDKNLYIENLTGMTVFLILRARPRAHRLSILICDHDPGGQRGQLELPDGQTAAYAIEGKLAACLQDSNLNFVIRAKLKRVKCLSFTAGRYRLADGPIIQLEQAPN